MREHYMTPAYLAKGLADHAAAEDKIVAVVPYEIDVTTGRVKMYLVIHS